jgi:uncharacterized protein (TIGR02996 family)
MTDGPALLQAILDQPEDDLPRLAYADWLDEQGGDEERDRAELIRLGVELERRLAQRPDRHELEAFARQLLVTAPGPFDFRRQVDPQSEDRIAELLARHGERWAAPFINRASAWAFRRGFVEEVALPPDWLALHARDLFAAAPLRAVHLRSTIGLKKLAELPELARLRRLGTLHLRMGPGAAAALGANPHLSALRALNLRQEAITDKGLRALARPGHLAGLTELGLWVNDLTAAGAEVLANHPTFRNLERLDLGVNRIGDLGMRHLAASRQLGSLTWLRVWNNRIGPAGARALAELPGLRSLRFLQIGGNHLDNAGVVALAVSPHLASLEGLVLLGVRFNADTARVLARSPHLAGLKLLRVDASLHKRARVALHERFGDALDVSNAQGEFTPF